MRRRFSGGGRGPGTTTPAAGVAEHADVVSRHGYHRLRVKAVVVETDDARSFVLEVPEAELSVERLVHAASLPTEPRAA